MMTAIPANIVGRCGCGRVMGLWHVRGMARDYRLVFAVLCRVCAQAHGCTMAEEQPGRPGQE